MNTERPIDGSSDDGAVTNLLREVGARGMPTSAMRDQVYRAAHSEWSALVERRARRHRLFAYGGVGALAASVLVAILVVELGSRQILEASVVRVDGSGEVLSADQTRPLAVRDRLHTGDTVRTSTGRVALDFGNGVTARLDVDSRLELSDRARVVLVDGRLYVDVVSSQNANPKLVVETAAGAVRHIGTQYEVRSVARTMSVSVREGRVEIESERGTSAGVAGESIEIAANGDVTRSAIAPHDPRWQWTRTIAPTFDIHGKPVQAFLDWMARETGKSVHYQSDRARQLAGSVILHGSIAGLDPDTALNAVLLTTPLRANPSDESSILIATAQ